MACGGEPAGCQNLHFVFLWEIFDPRIYFEISGDPFRCGICCSKNERMETRIVSFVVVYLMHSNLSFIDYPYLISAFVSALAAVVVYNYKLK